VRGRRAFALVAVALHFSACDGDAPRTTSAAALESRLLAPCCWTQTLDVHTSDAATELRTEIERRLANGEPAATVEDDLAARFGERIRAVPKGRDPRQGAALVTLALMALAGVGLAVVVRRWTRKAPATAPSSRSAPVRDEYDDRVDAELKEMDRT